MMAPFAWPFSLVLRFLLRPFVDLDPTSVLLVVHALVLGALVIAVVVFDAAADGLHPTFQEEAREWLGVYGLAVQGYREQLGLRAGLRDGVNTTGLDGSIIRSMLTVAVPMCTPTFSPFFHGSDPPFQHLQQQ
ncbi:hypothetical protein JCM11641_000795 [Rhodosporidiobolus odoratus]